MMPFEAVDGGEDASGAPCPPLAALVEPLQGRSVKGGILLVPALGAVTVKLPGGEGLAPVAPGDRGDRNAQLQGRAVVRIKGS